jgi:hypothetical protein
MAVWNIPPGAAYRKATYRGLAAAMPASRYGVPLFVPWERSGYLAQRIPSAVVHRYVPPANHTESPETASRARHVIKEGDLALLLISGLGGPQSDI